MMSWCDSHDILIFSFHYKNQIPYIFFSNQGRSPTGSWWEASPVWHCGICGVQIPRKRVRQFWIPMNAVENGILAVVSIVDFRGLICYVACGAMLLLLQRQGGSSPKKLIQEFKYCHDQLSLWFLMQFSSKYLQHFTIVQSQRSWSFASFPPERIAGVREGLYVNVLWQPWKVALFWGTPSEKTQGQDTFHLETI